MNFINRLPEITQPNLMHIKAKKQDGSYLGNIKDMVFLEKKGSLKLHDQIAYMQIKGLKQKNAITTMQEPDMTVRESIPGRSETENYSGESIRIKSFQGERNHTPSASLLDDKEKTPFPSDNLEYIVQYDTVETENRNFINNSAKRSVIAQLMGAGMDKKDSQQVEETLQSFPIESLLKLARHNVKINVCEINDMPEEYGIRNFMMKSHIQTIDSLFAQLLGKDTASTIIDNLSLTQKLKFLEKMIEEYGLSPAAGNNDFGVWIKINSQNPEDLKNYTMTPGIAVCHGYPGCGEKDFMGVFIVKHCFTKGVLLHEIGHTLDYINNPEDNARFDRDNDYSDDPSNQSGSCRDRNLVDHYKWYLNNRTIYPKILWSNYAGTSASEYTAEAVRVYLSAPGILKSCDPEMFSFIEAFLTEAKYPSLHFSTGSPGNS